RGRRREIRRPRSRGGGMAWRRTSTRWKPISSARAAPGPDAMRHGVIAGRAALLVALWAFLPAAPARAQGTQPLRKVELVRLLGSRAMSKAQVAGLVRRNCVTFRPSERDRADLRAAGADDALFTAIDQCGVATFRILAGTTPGTYRLTAALPSSGAATLIAFVTTPVTRPTPAPAPAPPVPAEALTQFTRGGGQHGTVGSTLGPVVLEV